MLAHLEQGIMRSRRALATAKLASEALRQSLINKIAPASERDESRRM